jgi:hypothetical protein
VVDPPSTRITAAMTAMIMTTTMCTSCASSRGTLCAVAINVVLIAVYRHNEAMQSFQFLDKAMSSRVLAQKDLHYPLPLCSMVYPDNDNDENGGSGKKIDPKYDGVTSLRQGGRRRRRGVEGGVCDDTSNIAVMGPMMLCKFEYNNDARFAATATNDGEDNNRGEGA